MIYRCALLEPTPRGRERLSRLSRPPRSALAACLWNLLMNSTWLDASVRVHSLLAFHVCLRNSLNGWKYFQYTADRSANSCPPWHMSMLPVMCPSSSLTEKGPLTISAQESAKVVYYRALYPFESRSHDEITIQPGDIVMVRKMAASVCQRWPPVLAWHFVTQLGNHQQAHIKGKFSFRGVSQ